MQATVVTMLMMLAGLGSYNKENDDIKPLPGNTEPALPADCAVTRPLYAH